MSRIRIDNLFLELLPNYHGRHGYKTKKFAKNGEIINNNLDELLQKKYQDEKLIRTKNFCPIFRCTCQRRKIIASIKQFSEPELLNERQKRTKLEVMCEYCGTVFFIAPEELDKTFKTRGTTE